MQNWKTGVELELHGVGRYRTVKSTEDAAHCLLSHWPRKSGKTYLAAQQACLDALEGATSADLAREAFISAALAAKIHIRSAGDPRQQAMGVGDGDYPSPETGSAAFRKANHEAMESIRKIVGKYKSKDTDS